MMRCGRRVRHGRAGTVFASATDGRPASRPAAGDTRREVRAPRPALNPLVCSTPSSRAGRTERGRAQASKSAGIQIRAGWRGPHAWEETGPKSSETRRCRIRPTSICTTAPILKPMAPNWAIKNQTIYEKIFLSVFVFKFLWRHFDHRCKTYRFDSKSGGKRRIFHATAAVGLFRNHIPFRNHMAPFRDMIPGRAERGPPRAEGADLASPGASKRRRSRRDA